MNFYRYIFKCVYTLFCWHGLMMTCFGQENSAKPNYYHAEDRPFLVEIPVWLPFFSGNLTYGEYAFSPAGDADNTASAFQSKLGIEFYFVGRVTLKRNNYWLNFDTFSGRINKSMHVSNTRGRETELIHLNVHANIPRLVGGYSVWQPLKHPYLQLEVIPYVGLRFMSIHLKSGIFDLDQLIDFQPHWFEPVLGCYIPLIYKRFKVELQMDIGPSPNNRTLIISNRNRFRFAPWIDMTLGFNYLQLHYDSYHNNKSLVTTLQLMGPTLGVGLRF